uniref:Uncharacterized protein n=1 Tax=Oncorhynchus kisutch TaxID=8019 RepID=A0A8C7DGE2_ONCKI
MHKVDVLTDLPKLSFVNRRFVKGCLLSRREETPRLRNLASVFLQDCCTKEQVARAEAPMQGYYATVLGSPFLRTRLTLHPS